MLTEQCVRYIIGSLLRILEYGSQCRSGVIVRLGILDMNLESLYVFSTNTVSVVDDILKKILHRLSLQKI